MPPRTHIVIAVNDITPQNRSAFNAAFDTVTLGLLACGAKTAHVTYAGAVVETSTAPLQLATCQAKNLVLPSLGDGHNLAVAMEGACVESSNDPNLIVVMSAFADTDNESITSIVTSSFNNCLVPHNYFLFVAGQNAQGQSMPEFVHRWLEGNFYTAVVAAASAPEEYKGAFDRLYNVFRHHR